MRSRVATRTQEQGTAMTDDHTNTIVLQQPAKSGVDAKGRPVREGPLEETEVELVSRERLESLLSEEGNRRQELEAIATDEEGVLGRRVHDDTFVIVDEAEVKAAIQKTDEGEPPEALKTTIGGYEDTGELSLVSTVVLNRMLKKEEEPEEPEPIDEELANFKNSGFDPYNSS
jgi:hypothetical protein